MRALLVVVVLVLVLVGALPLRADEIHREPLSLRLDAPADGHSLEGPSSLVEVKGWAGAFSVHQTGGLDIVAIVDISFSTRHGSGVDVDGDGHAGGFGWRFRRSFLSYPLYVGRSTDPDDSILRAEAQALRNLLDRLDLDSSRVGVIGLREYADVAAPIPASPNVMEGALRSLERRDPEGRTNFFTAIREANRLLREAPSDGVARERAIILLSDGYPTVPPGSTNATNKAIEAARESAEAGIKIFSFSLGRPAGELDSRALREAARLTGGKYVALDQPGDVIRALSEIRFTGLEGVEIQNVTSGTPAGMKRVFPSGSFDGFIRLKNGENRIRVTATSTDGETLVEERVVYYRLTWPHDRRERWKAKQHLDALHDVLQKRKAEEALLKEMNERRARLARELEIGVDEP